MKIGYTGSREGMTGPQFTEFKNQLWRMDYPTEFHHGDCIGGDNLAGRWVIWSFLQTKVIIHPPTDESRRAFSPGNIWLPPKPFIARNHDIVDATDIMVATPATKEEVKRSGTWATIRYAPSVVIIYPDGTIELRNKS